MPSMGLGSSMVGEGEGRATGERQRGRRGVVGDSTNGGDFPAAVNKKEGTEHPTIKILRSTGLKKIQQHFI